MANRFYGLNNIPSTMEQPDKVVTGSSTGSTDVEVRIDTTKSWNRQMLLIALFAIVDRITTGFDDLGAI